MLGEHIVKDGILYCSIMQEITFMRILVYTIFAYEWDKTLDVKEK